MKGSEVVNVASRSGQNDRPRWIYGLHAVERRLEAEPRSVIEVRLQPAPSDRRRVIEGLARRAGATVRMVDEETLNRLTGRAAHQGVAALARPFRYRELAAVIEARPGPVLVLDQIQDPYNLGALVRTAAAVGMTAVVLPERGAVGVTPVVEKTAAGAVNDVPICRVVNLARTLGWLGQRGYWSIALLPGAGEDLFAIDLPDRPVLVLGGETGVRPLVERGCDLRASIPMPGRVESLNASVAGAIAMYEIYRRRSGRGSALGHGASHGP